MSVKIVVNELRQARTRASLSQEELAEQVHATQGTVSKIENGKLPPARDFLQRCDDALSTGGLLVRLFDQVAQEEAAPTWFRPWLELERQATQLRTYEHALIPGLLQIEAYARAVLRDEVQVKTRLDRQAVLDSVESYVAVVDELALARSVGGPEVMADQIARLLDDGRATVHVVSASSGYYNGLLGAFTMATIDGTDVAYVQTQVRGYVMELPEDVAAVRRAWEGVVLHAHPREQSEAILKAAADRWKSPSTGSHPVRAGTAATASR